MQTPIRRLSAIPLSRHTSLEKDIINAGTNAGQENDLSENGWITSWNGQS